MFLFSGMEHDQFLNSDLIACVSASHKKPILISHAVKWTNNTNLVWLLCIDRRRDFGEKHLI